MGAPGEDPLNGAFMFLNRSLKPGDSGCLVLDTEFDPPRPYLIYLGKANTGVRSQVGFGLFIEQANRVWNIRCYK